MKVKGRISSVNLFYVLAQTIIGVGLLSLPHQTHHTAGSDGWISILITGFFIQLIVLIIWLLCRKFPNLTLFDFSKVILGKTLGTVVNFLYIIYLLTNICYIFIVYTDTLKRWILPRYSRMDFTFDIIRSTYLWEYLYDKKYDIFIFFPILVYPAFIPHYIFCL